MGLSSESDLQCITEYKPSLEIADKDCRAVGVLDAQRPGPWCKSKKQQDQGIKAWAVRALERLAVSRGPPEVQR